MNSKLKGNLAMGISKVFSGFNQNALKILVPNWMAPLSGVMIRLGFGAVAFWITSLFTRRTATPTKLSDRLKMWLLGALFMFGYMWTLLEGLALTTPISSSIFISMQPMVVFIIMALFYHEKVTANKVLGILLGIVGAVVIVVSQKTSDTASNPLLGDVYCFGSTLTYSIYLVASGQFLKKFDKVTVSKWTFSGGATTALIVVLFTGWHAPVFHQGLLSTPMLALMFVLLFPTYLSYFLLDTGLKNLSPTVVALYANVILIVSTIASYILGQDRFSWWQMLAIVLIIASVYFVEVAEAHTARKQTTHDAAPSKTDAAPSKTD